MASYEIMIRDKGEIKPYNDEYRHISDDLRFEHRVDHILYNWMITNYVPSNDEFFCIVGYNFDNLPSLIQTNYNGCIYLGYDINPYYMLYDIIEKNSEVLELHEDTILADQNISLNEPIYLKKIIINKNFSGNLFWTHNINVETIVIKSKNKILTGNSLLGFNNFSYICAPYFKLSDFYESKLKPFLVAGYLKMLNEGYRLDDEIKDSYEKYINRNFARLYEHSLNTPVLLEYLLFNQLIKKADLYGLIKSAEKYNKFDVLLKLQNYANNCFGIGIGEIKKSKISFIEIEQNLMDNNTTDIAIIEPQTNNANKASFRKFKGKYENYTYDNGDEFELPTPKRRKYETYIREMIKIGDLYVARYKNEVLVINVIEKGNRYHPRFKFNVVDYYEIENHSNLLTMYSDNTYDLEVINKIFKNNNAFVILNSLLANNRISMDGIELYPEFGLFKHNYYDCKLYEINNLINSSDVIVDRLSISFFENYFLLPVPSEYIDDSFNPFNDDLNYIVFRKVHNLDKIYEQAIDLKCDLLVDAIDLKCAIESPYQVVNNINDEITNAKGAKYTIKNIFRFISEFLTLGNRTASSKQIISLFSDYYQKNNDVKYIGFSSKEIMDFTNKYFAFDVVEGTYLAHDTIIDLGDKFICYDKMWFNLFYNFVKKSTNVIEKCSEVIVPVNKESFFRKFTIVEEKMKFYVECVKSTSSFEQFCDMLEEYYIYKYKI